MPRVTPSTPSDPAIAANRTPGELAWSALHAYAAEAQQAGAPVIVGYTQPAFLRQMRALRDRGRFHFVDACDHYTVGTQALTYWIASEPDTIRCPPCAADALTRLPIESAKCVHCRNAVSSATRVLGLAGCVITVIDLCGHCLEATA
jgi:hypothetical protein